MPDATPVEPTEAQSSRRQNDRLIEISLPPLASDEAYTLHSIFEDTIGTIVRRASDLGMPVDDIGRRQIALCGELQSEIARQFCEIATSSPHEANNE